MRNYILPLLLATAPLYAGGDASQVAAAKADCAKGWTFGIEALYLRPYQSEGGYDTSDYDLGGRISIGYNFSDCLFTRASYFGYTTDTATDEELFMSTIGLDIGQTFNPSDVLTLSPYVGLGYVNIEEDFDDTEFEGLGLVLGIDATRELVNNLSLYATAKQTIAFGSTDYLNRTSPRNSTDNVAFVSQLGLGLQHDFTNIDANIRFGFEGQWWSGVSDDDSEDIGLAGLVLGANFRF
jgi:hypothetical protein